jgi:hypothetical protein
MRKTCQALTSLQLRFKSMSSQTPVQWLNSRPRTGADCTLPDSQPEDSQFEDSQFEDSQLEDSQPHNCRWPCEICGPDVVERKGKASHLVKSPLQGCDGDPEPMPVASGSALEEPAPPPPHETALVAKHVICTPSGQEQPVVVLPLVQVKPIWGRRMAKRLQEDVREVRRNLVAPAVEHEEIKGCKKTRVRLEGCLEFE